jgi:hypothetical protein
MNNKTDNAPALRCEAMVSQADILLREIFDASANGQWDEWLREESGDWFDKVSAYFDKANIQRSETGEARSL